MNRRVPWLTIGVGLVTAAFTTAQFMVPDLLPALRRQPSMIEHGELWRFVTAWLVHDEGIKQIAINLPLLAIAGVAAEWLFARWVWALAFVLAGLTGEAFGLFWQPVGAGNSVAVLGLVGLVAVRQTAWMGRPMLQRFGWPMALTGLAIWLTASHDIHGPAGLMGLGFGVVMVWVLRMCDQLGAPA